MSILKVSAVVLAVVVASALYFVFLAGGWNEYSDTDTRELDRAGLFRIAEKLLEDSRVVGVSTFVGSGPPRFYLPVDSEYPYESFANIIVNTTSGDVVPDYAAEMAAWFDENLDQALVRVRLYGIGPSNPWKFQARFMGPTLNEQGEKQSHENGGGNDQEQAEPQKKTSKICGAGCPFEALGQHWKDSEPGQLG